MFFQLSLLNLQERRHHKDRTCGLVCAKLIHRRAECATIRRCRTRNARFRTRGAVGANLGLEKFHMTVRTRSLLSCARAGLMFTNTVLHKMILTVLAEHEAVMALTVLGPPSRYPSRAATTWALNIIVVTVFGDMIFNCTPSYCCGTSYACQRASNHHVVQHVLDEFGYNFYINNAGLLSTGGAIRRPSVLMLQSATDALHAEYVIATESNRSHKRTLTNWAKEILIERLDIIQLSKIKGKARSGGWHIR